MKPSSTQRGSMRRTIAGVLTIAALAGCGGSEPPSLDDGRDAWLELDGDAKTDLARTCRSRAAADVGESAGSAQALQGLESVDLDALIGRIDEWYAQERPQDRPIVPQDRPLPTSISEVCFAETQDLAGTAIQSEIEQIREEMELGP